MTLQIVINALDPERAAPVTCTIRPVRPSEGASKIRWAWLDATRKCAHQRRINHVPNVAVKYSHYDQPFGGAR